MTKDFVQYPQGNVLLRKLDKALAMVSHGDGIYLYDKAGNRYIDASGGALVTSLGHGQKEIVGAIAAQLERVSYVNGNHFSCESTEYLATALCAQAPRGLNKASFLCSGSEAIEAAIKFARQLWVERGQSKKTKIIARSPGYHGNTLYALSASARPSYKKFFGPLLSDVIMISSPYEYRSPVDYQEKGADFYSKALEDAILKEGAENISAFIFEPVIGSSAGGSPPPPGYFTKVQEICRRHNILMIADEVMCGAGRTGKFFASAHFDLEPDILVLGKGISGGYAPLSALLVREEHVEEMRKGSGGFMHMQTYMQAPAMTAAGAAVMHYFEKYKVVEHAQAVGIYFQEQLRERLLPLPYVGNISGIGLIAGVEFVEDKPSKKPFDRSKKFAEAFVTFAQNKGVLLWPNIGQADGVNGDLVMLGPPLIISRSQVDELVQQLEFIITSYFR